MIFSIRTGKPEPFHFTPYGTKKGMGTGQKKLKEGHNRRECKLKAERNERAEAARCSHIETNSIVKKAAKQIHTKREMDHHERT